MFKDKALRQMLFGFFHTQTPGALGKSFTLTAEDGTREQIETADGLVFHLLAKIKSLENKIAALEMKSYSVTTAPGMVTFTDSAGTAKAKRK